MSAPVLSLSRLLRLNHSGIQAFLRSHAYSDALSILRNGQFSRLEMLGYDKISIFSASIRSVPEGQITMRTGTFDEPIESRCSCSPGASSPRCRHAAFLTLVLWSAVTNNYEYERFLPSISHEIRRLGKTLRFYFSRELNEHDEKLAAKPLPSTSAEPVYLKRILFCPPSFDLLIQENNGLKFSAQSNNTRVPTANSFYPGPYAGRISHSDVPLILREFPQKDRLAFHSRSAEALRSCVQYEFSEGSVLTVGELLYHPLAEKVPISLLPIRSNILPQINAAGNIHLFEEASFHPYHGEYEMERILLSNLLQVSRQSAEPPITPGSPNSKEAQVKLALASTPQRGDLRAIFPLKRIEVADNAESKGRWEILTASEQGQTEYGRSTLVFKAASSGSPSLVFRNFELKEEDGTLRFHSYLKSVRAVNGALSRRLHDGLAPGFDYSSLTTRISLSGHQLVFSLLQSSNEWLNSEKAPTISITPKERIRAEGLTPEIFLNDRGEMSFRVIAPTSAGPIEIWNFPLTAERVLTWINGGIGNAVSFENTEIATRRRGQKRNRDLKVLKHAGLASLIFHEVLESLIEASGRGESPQTKTGSEVAIKKRVKRVFDILGKTLSLMEGPLNGPAHFASLPASAEGLNEKNTKPPSLDYFCSKNIQDVIAELTEDLSTAYNFAAVPVFTPDGMIFIEGVPRVMLKILQSLLKASVAETKGILFAKVRTGAFESFFSAPSESNEPSTRDFVCLPLREGVVSPPPGVQRYLISESHRSPRVALTALLPFMAEHFGLYWNGKSVALAEESDLRAELTLTDSEVPEEGSTDRIDWFELHPKVFFRGVEIDRTKLKQVATEGVIEFQGKFYLIRQKNLPSLKRLEQFWTALQERNKKTNEASARETGATHYLLPKSQTLELLALRASGAHVEGGPEWQKICQFYDSLDSERGFEALPSTIHAELKPYQKIGVQWLLDLHRLRLGGILADDMGLGKTIQTLAFLEKLRHEKRLGHGLIVVPTTLTYNWKSESARFTPELPIEIFQPKSREEVEKALQKSSESVWIVTYGLFVNHAEFFNQTKWDFLIFDEAQNLKNIAAKRTTHARSIEARFKLCLTGTPMENHVGELYSLLDLTVPGCLGDLTAFRSQYVSPELIQPEDVKYLKLKTKPLILRRTKGQILSELPPKTETLLAIPFEQKQKRLYRDIALSWNEKIKGSVLSIGEAKSQLLMLTALLRLRQACSDPSGIPGIIYDEEPPKISALLESLQEITESGESALVFTQFLHTMERLSRTLTANQVPHLVIHGAITRKERERILQEFQENQKGSVLLMTLKTGGVGLNLVKASYVFHVEPWWNPAVENQATDRAHRMGQTRPVQVFRYIMRESVEEKIEILKGRKSARFNAFFSVGANAESLEAQPQGSSPGSFLSQEDFTYLLS